MKLIYYFENISKKKKHQSVLLKLYSHNFNQLHTSHFHALVAFMLVPAVFLPVLA